MENDNANDEIESPHVTQSIETSLAEIIESSMQLLIPVAPMGGAEISPNSKYSPVIHAKICRMKMLGMNDASIAKAIGVTKKTLEQWQARYPRLVADMEQAESLTNAHTVLLLRKMMESSDASAFQAIKFWLTTHMEEFQEKQRIELSTTAADTVRNIREHIYGLPPANSPPNSGGGTPAASEGDE